MSEPQPSPERETLSPALRESMEMAVHYEVAGTDGDFNDEDTARKAMLRFARVFAVRAKAEGYAEGRQAGAQEERERQGRDHESGTYEAIGRYLVQHGRWIRHDYEHYAAAPVAFGANLESPGMRFDALKRATSQDPQEPQR